MPSQSQPPLFKPFRALGYITENVPFAVQRRGREAFVTVSAGRVWQVYNCAKLSLVLVGPQLRGDIRALAAKKDFTYAGVGCDIVACKRVHRYGVYRGAPEHGPVVQLIALGEQLLSLHAGGFLVAWDLGEYKTPKAVMELGAEFGTPTCMTHPDTYLNKVLVGGDAGALQLWNFSTSERIHTFAGWPASPGGVRCLCASPALDVIGVGLGDGSAVLHNVRFDETVARFGNAAGTGVMEAGLLGGGAGRARAGGAAAAAVTSLSFRTGGGTPLLAAAGASGAVTVWDLEEKKLHSVLREAHDGPVHALHFFPGEPLLMSSGGDNSIKQWLFDGADESGRLLRFRSGHAAPPVKVLHYGEGGQRLLSAGRDRAFRCFSVIQDQQSRELSQRPGGGQAKRAKQLGVTQEDMKLGRIVGMAAEQARERDWANVLTAHKGDPAAYVWRLSRFSIGEHRLLPPPPPRGIKGPPNAPATCVALSPCGNFGLVGSASGRIDRYNMQSGIHRGAYSRTAAATAKGATTAAFSAVTLTASAHEGVVVGMGVDSCSRLMVSAGVDKALRVWNFKTGKLVSTLAVGSPVTHLHLHSGSALCAIGADDLMIRLYDIEAARLVRRFVGHTDRLTAIQVSADARWLLSASMDGSLRVWDVPSARCLQSMSLAGPPVTSLSLSPAHDLLATTHADSRGIYLWANQNVFGDAADAPLPSDTPVRVGMPTLAVDGDDDAEAAGVLHSAVFEAADSSDDEGPSSSDDEGGEGPSSDAELEAGDGARPYEAVVPETGAPAPLAPSLVTLSLLPRSQWQSLVHLEAIQARNRPIEPPKKPEAAPFFLPTVAGLARDPVFDTDPAAAAAANPGEDVSPFFEQGAPSTSRVNKAGLKRGAPAPPPFMAALRAGAGSGPAAAAAVSAPPTKAGSKRPAEAAAAAAVASDGRKSDGNEWAPLLSMLRRMTPNEIDREMRAMQVLEGTDEEDTAQGVDDIRLLLTFLGAQLRGGADGAPANFEFVQGLTQLALQVHGDTVMSHASLLEAAQALRSALRPAWKRVDGLLQDVRCMVSYFGNLQG